MKMRGIKPDFWTDEDVVEVSAFARLLFIGLWHMACDNGHVKDSPKRIKMSILPADDVDIDCLLGELDGVLIMRCSGWIVVPNLARHQRIDRRYFLTCDHDGCTKPEHVDTPRSSTSPALDTTSTPRVHDVYTTGPRDEGEGEGEGEGESVVTSIGAVSVAEPVATAVATPPKPKRGTRLPTDFTPSEKSRHIILGEAPMIDLRREHAKFMDHWKSQPGQRGVKLDWDATWRNWMRKAAEQAPNGKSRRQQEVDGIFDAALARAQAADAAEAAGLPIEGVIL